MPIIRSTEVNLNLSTSSWLFILLFIIQDARSNEIQIFQITCDINSYFVEKKLNVYKRAFHITAYFVLITKIKTYNIHCFRENS
jgi:hypothetical protein